MRILSPLSPIPQALLGLCILLLAPSGCVLLDNAEYQFGVVTVSLAQNAESPAPVSEELAMDNVIAANGFLGPCGISLIHTRHVELQAEPLGITSSPSNDAENEAIKRRVYHERYVTLVYLDNLPTDGNFQQQGEGSFPWVHGMGNVISADGANQDYAGALIAHEIGHYFGLSHVIRKEELGPFGTGGTSEQRDNLMFPLLITGSPAVLTEAQCREMKAFAAASRSLCDYAHNTTCPEIRKADLIH